MTPWSPTNGGDRLQIRCRAIKYSELHLHCYVYCCDQSGCHVYSLLNDGAAGGCPAQDDPRDTPSTTDKIVLDEPMATAGTCQCLFQAYQNNDRCIEYNPFECNSNWYAASLVQCCTGERPTQPANAPGWNNCCRKDVRFNCPAGYPGGGHQPLYGCGKLVEE